MWVYGISYGPEGWVVIRFPVPSRRAGTGPEGPEKGPEVVAGPYSKQAQAQDRADEMAGIA